MSKACTKCGKERPESDFPLVGSRRPGARRTMCIDCKRKAGRKENISDYESYLANRRDAKYRRRFKMSRSERDELVKSVGGRCMACGDSELESFGPLGLDHDHGCCPGENTCGMCIRGVLCFHCNLALGYLKDDATRVGRLFDYIVEVGNGGKRRLSQTG